MQESPPPYQMAPPGATASSYGSGPLVVQKERPFALGLVLTVVTLGIYPLFWHFLTHDELSRQMGVPNRAKVLWVVYIVLFAANFLASFTVPDDAIAVDPEDPEAAFERLIAYGPLLALSGIISMAMLVLYIVYVSRQWDLVRDAKMRMGLALRGSKSRFFWLYFGSIAIALLFFWLVIPILAPLVMIPIAYFYLNENYNDIAAALRTGSMDRHLYRPGGEGWRTHPQPMASGTAAAPVPEGQATAAHEPLRLTWIRTDDPGLVEAVRAAGTASDSAPDVAWEGPPAHDARSDVPTNEHAEEPAILVEQAFQCPRCHTHVTARGVGGNDVVVRCARCGETGTVRMPVV